MNSGKGYRLKAGTVAELSGLIEDFRTASLRLLAKRYGTMVARKAASDLDSYRLGLSGLVPDPFASASASVRSSLKPSASGLPFADLNCAVTLHLVKDAVLARFVHGNEDYRHAWESMRGVVRWGWRATAQRPKNISEKDWEARARYWEAASARPGFGCGMRFVLVEGELPTLGWGGVRRYLPGFEARVENAAAMLDAAAGAPGKDRADLRARAMRTIDRELTKESFIAGPAAASRAEAGPAERMRETAKAARKAKPKATAAVDPDKASTIDHADVLVSADGRTFVAAPYVGLDPENRVFIQVGDSHVAVSQGGLQYGYVTDVPKSAIDLLRLCRTVILVEVARKDGGRLLRAKHVAIVSDISLSDNLNISLGSFNRTRSLRGEREIKEWDSGN